MLVCDQFISHHTATPRLLCAGGGLRIGCLPLIRTNRRSSMFTKRKGWNLTVSCCPRISSRLPTPFPFCWTNSAPPSTRFLRGWQSTNSASMGIPPPVEQELINNNFCAGSLPMAEGRKFDHHPRNDISFMAAAAGFSGRTWSKEACHCLQGRRLPPRSASAAVRTSDHPRNDLSFMAAPNEQE